ncbi:MAG: hypothetical protein ACI8TX_003131 [Hyphomicrobiaceae bacterium]
MAENIFVVVTIVLAKRKAGRNISLKSALPRAPSHRKSGRLGARKRQSARGCQTQPRAPKPHPIQSKPTGGILAASPKNEARSPQPEAMPERQLAASLGCIRDAQRFELDCTMYAGFDFTSPLNVAVFGTVLLSIVAGAAQFLSNMKGRKPTKH